MNNKPLYILIIVFICFIANVQTQGFNREMATTTTIDTLANEGAAPASIQNVNAITGLFSKLKVLKVWNSGKVNIVHIGDSHVQSDVMTHQIRKVLQEYFGNGGRGLVFPHNLAKTNGASDYRFTSNVIWKNDRNISAVNSSEIGLSGIALSTKSKKYIVQFSAKDPANYFNTIKILTPKNDDSFQVATAKENVVIKSSVPKIVIHKIKKGETLSEIADEYSISISQLKKANALRSDRITFGKTLKIPTDEKKEVALNQTVFKPLGLQKKEDYYFYKSEDLLGKIYLVPNADQSKYVLNGVILERDDAGVIYSGIGVNGAKFSDFNKCPLFFDQLKALDADLYVVSFGTNESYGKLTNDEYMKQLKLFLENVRAKNPNALFLLVTPPPSFLPHHALNTIVNGYCEEIVKRANENNYAVCDLYVQAGGMHNVEKNFSQGIISADRVHYTVKGYEFLGNYIAKEIIKAFQTFNKE